MARAASNVLQSLIKKLPTGFALGARGGVLDAVLSAVADLIATVEARAEQLMAETDPRNAVELLEDYERVLGPDPCRRDLSPMTLPERQALAFQRWTSRGGQSVPYLLSIAEKLGVTVTIAEHWPSRANRARAGQRLRPEGCQWVMLVIIPEDTPLNAALGTACELQRVVPATTHLVIRYGAA